MNIGRNLLRLCGIGAVLVAAGCAPTFGTGLEVGLTPGGWLHVGTASCSFLGSRAPGTAFSSTAQITNQFRQIQAIQARYQLGSQTPQAQMQGWKRLAEGGC
jgi:hypothetical protein